MIWFPFDGVARPAFRLARRWDLRHLVGHLRTWAAEPPFRARHGTDPLDPVREGLAAAWGDPWTEREVVWPLHLRSGRVV
jgi:hypothetical protein